MGVRVREWNAAVICGKGRPFKQPPPPPSPLQPPTPMKMINVIAHKVYSTRENSILSVMDLLEPGGRKFVELGSAAPPGEVVEEEVGADAAITPETLSQSPHLRNPAYFFLLYSDKISFCAIKWGKTRLTDRIKMNERCCTCWLKHERNTAGKSQSDNSLKKNLHISKLTREKKPQPELKKRDKGTFRNCSIIMLKWLWFKHFPNSQNRLNISKERHVFTSMTCWNFRQNHANEL